MEDERRSTRLRFIFGRAAILGAALITILALGPAQALAGVSCGDVLTKDTKLSSDIRNCPGDGLIVGADHIKLNLNGHTLDGQGSGVGIAVYGHGGIEIKNGIIQEFSNGVELTEATDNKLRNLTVRGNLTDGVSLNSSRSNRIEDNRSRENGSDGITLYQSNQNRIEENSLSGNDAHGIVLETDSNLNRVEDNRVHENHADGISIAVNSSRNEILENRVIGNSGSVGIFLVFGSNQNRVKDNLVSENGGGGILVMEADENRIEKNKALANGGDGIVIDDDSGGTLVKSNVANRNSDDGIDAAGATSTLTKNSAKFNGSLGIRAVAGVTDGGGNTASGNGDAAQCTTNIVCSIRGGTIEVDPHHIDFGQQPYNSFTKRTLTVVNESSKTLSVTVDSTFVPDDFSPGQPESTCPWGVATTLAPGETCTHVIGYYADPAEPFQGHREIELQVVARDESGKVVKTRAVKVTAMAVPG